MNKDFICLLNQDVPKIEEELQEWVEQYGYEDLEAPLSFRSQMRPGKPSICPLSYIYKYEPLALEIWNMYHMAKQFNSLPYQGGLMDQPNIIVEAFSIIDDEINKYNKKQQEKNK